MTTQPSFDVLDLAEAVAAGDLRPDDAEARVRSSSQTVNSADRAVLELRELTTAVGAVRAHAIVTRAFDAAQPRTAIGPAVVALPVRGRAVRRGGRRGRGTHVLVAAMLLLGAAVFGIVVGGGGRIAQGPTPALPAVVSTASPIAQGSDAAPGNLTFGELDAIELVRVTEDVGWVRSPTSVFRTGDGGLTWSDVRPPVRSSSIVTAFVDGDTVFVTPAGPSIQIAVTHDAGQTWQAATIDDASATGIAALTFRGRDVAFATVDTPDPRTLHVYRTTDGGATWFGPSVSTIPDGINDGMHGIQPETGLVLSNGQRDGQPFDDRLVLSADGGATWQDRMFPVDATTPAGALRWVDTAWTDGTGRWVIVVNNGERHSIQTSDDDGRTWRLVRDWPRTYDIRLMSATEWVGLASDLDAIEMWSTQDGGSTWRTEIGPSRLFLDIVSLASPDVAWGVHRCDRAAGPWFPGPDPYCDGRAVEQVLLATSDGGRTWMEVAE
jgi:photosystem II stability/assembly factor-like uncharacterized protein